jgi:hypothetical protein
VALAKAGLGALLAVPLGLLLAPPLARASSLDEGNAAFDAGRYAVALRAWSAAAQAGDATAAFDIGLLNDLGDGVPENATTAFQWYRRAAEAGLAAGQFNVGVMYDSGRGVPCDRAEAALWYARAAAQGHPRAAFNLGQLYETGDGVPRNPAVAAAWYAVAGPAIPVAAGRAETLAALPPAAATAAPLVPPVPVWPRAGAAVPLPDQTAMTELVWAAPPEPRGVHYFVELRALRNGSYAEVATTLAGTSAAVVALTADHDFAWRVYAVADDGSSYVPSGWSLFDTGAAAQEAALSMPHD